MITTGSRTPRGSAPDRPRRQERAATRLRDERSRPLPPWLASRTGRRALALLPVLTIGLGILGGLVPPGVPSAVVCGLVSLAGAHGVVLLRRATRWLDTAPEVLLDEREIADRDRAQRTGSRLVIVLLGALAVIAGLDGVLAEQRGVDLVTAIGWFSLVLSGFFAASMMTATALAWTWRAPAEDVDGPDD